MAIKAKKNCIYVVFLSFIKVLTIKRCFCNKQNFILTKIKGQNHFSRCDNQQLLTELSVSIKAQTH